ncbi:hypothetical protein [Aurantiacibacter spongiae]|uniref:Uncharacterized protein n=1 Tax=Aurantiacibacter spongiae TaxID=2488860 RepID=A0A3N5D7C5_9SPHN|nr:hypothetical protein [Aurantiacibacter spongiae]RPF70428.1 hypothetical protein EG799_01390 [Aurantiacibacter spongiae]
MILKRDYLWNEPMTVLIALIAGYVGLLVMLAVMAKPHRQRIARLANELVADYPQNEKMGFLCQHYTATAYAWRAAPIMFVSYVAALLIPGDTLDEMCEREDREHPHLLGDPRLRELMHSYDASIAAVNPIFGALMYAALWAFGLKARIHYRGKYSPKLVDYVGVRAVSA